MNRIDTITLDRALPRVFAGSEKELPVRDSQVWLGHVEFERPGRYLVEAQSGAGKSSLCAFIYGSRNDYEGHILINGTDISSFSIARWTRLRCRSLAYLPQEMRLFPELTAMENILVKNRLTDFKTASEITAMLDRLGVADKAGVEAGKLSVGQQQRVAIVRALCQPMDFLLIDEPVSHLDARNNSTVAALIEEEAARQDASIIATSVGNDIDIKNFTVLHL